MKILSVNNTADRYGASRCMERVFGRLAEGGHEIHAVLPEDGPLSALLEARGVHVHLHPGLTIVDRNQLKSFTGLLRFLVGIPLSVLFLVRLILRLRINVVHTNTVVLPSPSLAAFLTRRPHVWHIRETLQEFGSLWRPYQRWIWHFSAAIVAISCCVRDQFDPALQGKVRVIYDGLDDSTGKPDPLRTRTFKQSFPTGATLIGVVGRIKWHRKGQEVLVRAAALLRDRYPQALYVIVGTPSFGNEDHEVRLRALIAKHGLQDTVRLVGEIEDTTSIFAALDIAVAPSVQLEPFGCVVSEAMSAGTAVIGSRAGGIAEQIVHEQTGLLFTPGDPEDLACELEKLLTDTDLRLRLAAAGELRVRSHFPLSTTTSDMLKVFEGLQPNTLQVQPSPRCAQD